MERGHVEVVLRLWCACVSGCGGEMLLVSAPHGGALGPCLACRLVCARKRTQKQLVSLRRRIWRHGTCALGHPRSSERPAAGGSGDPGTCAKPAKAGAGRWGGALRAVTPSAAGLSSARPVALPGRWRAEAPAGGEDERRRQHGRPEAKPQTPAPAETHAPHPGAKPRGLLFFRWYCFGFERYDFLFY